MSVNRIDGQSPQIQQEQVQGPAGAPQAQGAPAPDVAGAPSTVTAPSSSSLPVSSLSEAELREAIGKLEAKTPDIQKAVSEAVAAFAANSQLSQAFNAQVYNGLMKDVVSAAQNRQGLPFVNLYAQVTESLEAARAAAGSPAVLAICDTAAKIVDLLQEPQTEENAKKIAALLADLGTQSAKFSADADKVVATAQKALDKALADLAKNDTPENRAAVRAAEAALAEAREAAAPLREAAALGLMLGNVLGLTSEAAKLGEALHELLKNLKNIILPKTGPDALAFSEKVTGAAAANLLLILATQVREEAAKRMEQAEKELQAMQEMRDKDKEFKKFLRDRALSENETRKNSLAASSAVNSILAGGGPDDETWRLLNDIIAQSGAGQQSVHPA